MKSDTVRALAAFIEIQRAANLKCISTIIEIIKLLPAGPAREPAIERLQAFVEDAHKADDAANELFEVLRKEV